MAKIYSAKKASVFVSWSGAMSNALAEAFHRWLPSVLENVEPFFSGEQMGIGSVWVKRLHEELAKASIGVFFVTKENIKDSTRMMYEAGAIGGRDNGSGVCVVLVDVSPDEIKGPYHYFHASSFSKNGFLLLLEAINRADNEVTPIPTGALKAAFDAKWSQFETEWREIVIQHSEHSGKSESPSVAGSQFRGERTNEKLVDLLASANSQRPSGVYFKNDNEFSEWANTYHHFQRCPCYQASGGGVKGLGRASEAYPRVGLREVCGRLPGDESGVAGHLRPRNRLDRGLCRKKSGPDAFLS